MTLLHIEHLTHYFGGLRAVQDFNLELQPGELVAIIGPNGAGKTTVFNLITGVYHPTEGNIVFQGSEYLLVCQRIRSLAWASRAPFKMFGSSKSFPCWTMCGSPTIRGQAIHPWMLYCACHISSNRRSAFARRRLIY